MSAKLHEIKLPSGAMLRVNLASFADSKELFQSFLEEAQKVRFDFTLDSEVNLDMFKDIIFIGLSSKKIERALWECMKVALYNDKKINEETFESEEARQDYLPVVFEVARLNIAPFTKNLFALLLPLKAVMEKGLAPR